MPGQLKVKVGGVFVPAAASGAGGAGSGADEVWIGPNAPTSGEKLWVDTDEAAALPNDVRWDTAWGVVAEGTMPASTDIATGADAAVTNVLNFTSVPGRKYVISFRTRAAGIYSGGNGQGYGRFVIWDSIANAAHMNDQWFVLPPNQSRWDNLTCEFKFNGDGVARGYYVRAYVQDLIAGSVVRFHTESASLSCWYYIRDIGPVVGSIPAVGSPTTAWQSWTPTWTCDNTPPSVGNGTMIARYVQIGKVVTVQMFLSFGSTTSGGTGNWHFTLPVQCVGWEQQLVVKGYTNAGNFVGSGHAQGGSVTPYLPVSSSSCSMLVVRNTDATAAHGTGIPVAPGNYTFTTSGNLVIFGTYEAA